MKKLTAPFFDGQKMRRRGELVEDKIAPSSSVAADDDSVVLEPVTAHTQAELTQKERERLEKQAIELAEAAARVEEENALSAAQAAAGPKKPEGKK